MHGHTGHPWNEAADVLAKCAVAEKWRLPIRERVCPEGPCNLLQRKLHFISLLPGDEKIQYPQIANGKLKAIEPFLEVAAEKIAERYSEKSEARSYHKEGRPVKIKASQYNVCTLLDKDKNGKTISARQEHNTSEGLRSAGTSKSLQDQFNDEGYDIVRVEEARTTKASRTTEHYHVIAGGGDGKGHQGCECWIRRVLKYKADGSEKAPTTIAVQMRHIVTLYADPRGLFVSVRTAVLRFVIPHPSGWGC